MPVTRGMRLLGGAVSFIFAIAIPLLYLGFSLDALYASLRAETAGLAKTVEQIIQDRPDLWEFEHIRLLEILSQPAMDGGLDERSIRTSAGIAVLKNDFTAARPAIAVSVSFFDSGNPVGSIEARHSFRKELFVTALLGMLSTTIGYLFYFIFLTYPVKRLEKTLEDLQQAEEEERRSRETAERLAQEMAIIAEIGRLIGSTLDIDEVYERFAAEAQKLIPYDSLIVNLNNTRQETLEVAYVSGLDMPDRRVGDSFPFRGSMGEEVIQAKRGLILQMENPEDLVARFPSLIVCVQASMHSIIGVPLISRDEVVGTLMVRSKKPKAYTEQDLRLAEKIGMQIAGAIANAQLFKDLSRTEKSLRESEAKYRDLVEFLPISVFEIGTNTRIISLNHTALETFRYSAEDPIKDMAVRQFFIPGEWGRLEKDFQEVMDGASKSSIEYQLIRKDGSTFTGLVSGSPIIRQGVAAGVRGAVIDITDRIRATEELQKAKDYLLQSEKLAAIGRLAAGVMHEILNPVNIISLELQLLMKESELSPKARQMLAVCMEQIQRIVTIAEGLKRFSSIKENRLAMSNIAAAIDNILMLYRPQLKMNGIQTDVQYPDDLPMTLMDEERIKQVILNLIENATDAMEEKEEEEKVLRITIGMRTVPGRKDCLRVMIADTGTGIRNQDMTKLFEPFYTTKAPDRGTGLGLSISFGIIKDHGGRIWAENNEWGGASFFFEIPITVDMLPAHILTT